MREVRGRPRLAPARRVPLGPNLTFPCARWSTAPRGHHFCRRSEHGTERAFRHSTTLPWAPAAGQL